MVALAAALLIAFPEQRGPSIAAFWEFLLEMVWVMPAVLVIMGLFAIWVPKEAVNRYMGRGSGARGMLIALIFGTLPTGPLYAAFPLTKGLLEKGASPANVFAFMAAWACIKIPQELIELQFLGWRFTLARFVSTVIVIVAMSFVFQRLLGSRERATDGDV
jgi:uncharacterized membrane protein YraQ (UPF0718 family)